MLRFYSLDLFNLFSDGFLSYDKTSKRKLRFGKLVQKKDSEDVLIYIKEFPELHFHSGQANLDKVQSMLENLIPENSNYNHTNAKSLSIWEECFSNAIGYRAIEYLIGVKNRGFGNENKNDYDIEGYEYLKPIKLVLTGPANAGKSTLFNLLCGEQRALISPIAGTTRDLLKASITLDGYHFVMIDTAGTLPSPMIHDDIQKQSNKAALNVLQNADILLSFNTSTHTNTKAHIIQIHSKADLHQLSTSRLNISAKTGFGIKRLEEQIIKVAHKIKKGKVSDRFFRDL